MRIAETSLPQFPTSSPIPLPLPPSTTNMQLSAGTERTSHATCSISSSACDSDHSTPPIDRSPTRFKRRRRSRARPSPPITRVLALNKAHFKSVVHQFTDNDASPGKCLAPAPSLVPTASLQPRRRPPAPVYHGPVPSSFAHCLNSTLRMLLSCVVEFVHGHSQNYAFATSSPVTTNAMALLQALCCSEAHGHVDSQQQKLLNATSSLSNEPLWVPVFSPYDDTSFRATLQSDQEFLLKASIDEIPTSTSRVHSTDGDTLQPPFGDSKCPTSTIQHYSQLKHDCTNSLVSSDDQSSFADHVAELERFVFDGLNGNEEIDDLGSLDFGLSSNWALSHEDLLGLS